VIVSTENNLAVEREGRTHGPLTGRLLFGAALVGLGVLWTLDNLDVLDASIVTRWWPLLFVGYGILRVTGADGCKRPVSGAIFAVLGALFLLNNLDAIDFDVFDLWPLFVIAIGVNILHNRARASAQVTGPEAADQDSYPRPFALMGGNERRLHSQDLTGFEASAVMGGVELDLRGAKARGTHVYGEVFAMWGGIDIVVPPDWRVVCEATPIMGGVENKADRPVEPVAATLVVRGLLIMGGLEIKTRATE
jgi:hypothetical protein